MPVMNGKEMIEQLRQDPELKDTVVLMVSANIQSIRDSSDINCDAFLAKPVNLEQLWSLLDQYLQPDWQTIENEPKSDDITEFITPEQTELINLLELVDFGNMAGLLQQIDLLESTDSQYIPLVREIRQLALNCQQEKLEKLLQALIEK